MILDAKSLKKLEGIHPDLVSIIKSAADLTLIDFIVTEGLRTKERQRALVAIGASHTMNSRHLTGHAVDLAAKVGGEVRWDWPLYSKLAETMKFAATKLKLPIEWGGDWTKLRDGPHFQLPWDEYPLPKGE